LATIGGDDAKRALQDALGKVDRDDVKVAIEQVLKEMK